MAAAAMVAQSSMPKRICDIDALRPRRARVTVEMATKQVISPPITAGLLEPSFAPLSSAANT